jgi:hypothetical protein
MDPQQTLQLQVVVVVVGGPVLELQAVVRRVFR